MDFRNWRKFSGLEWRQPHALRRSFVLQAGESEAGQLEFRSAFGSLAEARMGDAVWTFKRTGFFATRVTARIEGSEEDAAVYEPGFMGSKGVLTLTGGEQLRLKSANLWATDWTLSDSIEREILRFHNEGFLHHGAAVGVSEYGWTRDDLPLLVALTWYVLVLHMEDAHAASAGA